ncbi:ADP-ribosylglycohydrolase family protein [Pseudobutyrivibrio ruminis]|uniref:ADP-ribosylglycohydrolase family protein n=1 Tax=Pseudobutyrivibrio ruminis TaxID=46206 RepID=UPI000A451ED0|nr:ADP-ribosylglycohydrolase family protein [Pseudobutyrivibrio ruminis]
MTKGNDHSAIMGVIVGDALGVPVEFTSREERKADPVTGMRAYGTHNQPAGTWSDDSSMTIATLEWYKEAGDTEPDYSKLMDKFTNWLMYGEYTPYGENFDNGVATARALIRYGKGAEPLLSGGITEWDNGNGSLMRAMPTALHHKESLAWENVNDVEYIYNMSALTHAHPRSKLACLIYSKLVADILLSDMDKLDEVKQSLDWTRQYLEEKESDELIKEEIKSFERIWDIDSFMQLSENEIKSSGYVVDTLEAAIWCFLNTNSYAECVLKAVNLGDDTDTVGAVAGGLAGACYGMDDIPCEWLDVIPKKEWIEGLV